MNPGESMMWAFSHPLQRAPSLPGYQGLRGFSYLTNSSYNWLAVCAPLHPQPDVKFMCEPASLPCHCFYLEFQTLLPNASSLNDFSVFVPSLQWLSLYVRWRTFLWCPQNTAGGRDSGPNTHRRIDTATIWNELRYFSILYLLLTQVIQWSSTYWTIIPRNRTSLTMAWVTTSWSICLWFFSPFCGLITYLYMSIQYFF